MPPGSEDEVVEGAAETVEQPKGQANGGAGEPSSTVESEGIVVGNQKFATAQELAKAYAELQKGHTQANQRYSDELKAYKSIKEYLGNLQKDPNQWQRFQEYIKQGQKPAQAAQSVAREDGSEELRSRLEETEARLEWNEFKGAHPELSDDERKEVVKFVLEQAEEGKDLSLEHAYKLVMFDRHAAKLVSDTQRKTEDAVKKGKAAGGIGGAPTGAQAGAKKDEKKNFFNMKSEKEKNAHVLELAKKLGITWDD